MERLDSTKSEINEAIQIAKLEGSKPTPQVHKWLQEVEVFQQKARPILEQFSSNSRGVIGCTPNGSIVQQYKLSQGVVHKLDEAEQLIKSCQFQIVQMEMKSPLKVIEQKLGPSLDDQIAAQDMIQRLVGLLKTDKMRVVAVWGMGGVGKTTLVRNFNNKLSHSYVGGVFDMVMWVDVSKDLDLRRVQSQIAERLNFKLESEESTQRRADRLLHRILEKKQVLIILDDVWEKINLDEVGLPYRCGRCKILLTTRSYAVCREMETNAAVRVDVLSETAAWELFVRHAGPVVTSEDIYPLAREIARKCDGLPLAIKAVGSSMRGKTMTGLWKNAVCEFRQSLPHFENIQTDVYLPIKMSYNSLPSNLYKWCFLFCAMYPESSLIRINELIFCWFGDGLLDDRQTLEELFNSGISILEYLKDACLLECGQGIDTIKVHGLFRDVAVHISSSEMDGEFFFQPAMSLQEVPDKCNTSHRRISLMDNKITKLPSRLPGFSELTTLFLQDNPIGNIPDGFFRELIGLRVLSLSGTLLTSLPSSIRYLQELRILLLKDCSSLENLPPVGALQKLQVLNLCGTSLRELPKELKRLKKLRSLDLSNTHQLENIGLGTISGLSGLESLDMSYSAYKWDRDKTAGIDGATLDELISLKPLSVLRLRLDSEAITSTTNSPALDSAFLKRLRSFTLWVSPQGYNSQTESTSHEEKRIILRGMDLLDTGVEALLASATSLELLTCGCQNSLLTGQYGLASLESLTITSCVGVTSLASGESKELSATVNLMHLKISRLKRLETILDGPVLNEGWFRRLRTLEVTECQRLKNLLSFSLLCQAQSLASIKVGDCKHMKSIISGRVPVNALPNLKLIELKNMVSLRSICLGTSNWPSLEKIEVSNCPLLDQLPLAACNTRTIKEIRGDWKWWESLIWDDERTKMSIQRRFQQTR
ncbi:hypothetical protein QQ045_025906 [Rhodiola kirilowii]